MRSYPDGCGLFCVFMDYLNYALLIVLLLQALLAYRERKELTDRLMAKDLTDYKVNEVEVSNDYGEEEDDEIDEDLVPVEEARDEIEHGK